MFYLMALCAILDYSGRKAATVGSVLVTNLKTGLRKGGSDRVDV
jgi:septum formation protein